MSGFIAIDRKLLDWQYHDIPTAFSIWIHILMMANWKDGFFLGETIPRGSLATSYAHLAAEVGIDPKTLRIWLDRFEKAGMIERKSSNRFTIIKVLNYSTFQDITEEGTPQRIPQQIPERIPQQTPQQMPHNRTKKQEEQRNNIPPYAPPKGERKRRERSGIRIDTPEWYKKQQSGDLDVSEADPEETEAIIAEIEDLKRRINE